MVREEKELLLKDLCGRLPYVVFMGNKEWNRAPYQLTCDEVQYAMMTDDWDDVPYLRPLSSMTEEEKAEYKEFVFYTEYDTGSLTGHYELNVVEVKDIPAYIDWLNAHYFDYRGLIEMGLALPAPEGMYDLK